MKIRAERESLPKAARRAGCGSAWQTFTFYRFPQTHHKHLKSTNLLERLHQELKRRSLVVRIFPNDASCLHLIRALAAQQHKEWLDGARYLDMQPLADLTKTQLQLAALPAPPSPFMTRFCRT